MSISELCEQIDDERTLRLSLLDELRQLVPFESFAWLLTDPASEVGVSPIADVPCLADLPRLIGLKYATEINRWTTQHEPVARLHAATGGRLDQSLVWRELLSHHHVSDVASMVFRDRFGCWAFLDLWRFDGAFTDMHARALADHSDLITAALRRSTLRTFSPPTDTRRRHPWPGPIVLLLSDQLEVHGQTPETDRYLRALVPPDRDRPPVPAGAYNVAAQLLAVEAGIDDHQPAARVSFDDGEWLAFRAARIGADIAMTESARLSNGGRRWSAMSVGKSSGQSRSEIERITPTSATSSSSVDRVSDTADARTRTTSASRSASSSGSLAACMSWAPPRW
jgi:hypothetical protein